ncbi:uncharacterized protein LOC126322563 [Schistocerca gregaria]|uniref:uncharacterized protein LOC126322563 n=1 Tax=Schistocerca gregaria TaxID=7010 RepID=UPI00211EEC99|nr:uncharacterized protein LOC126322563 [Schistocerca gregaria]
MSAPPVEATSQQTYIMIERHSDKIYTTKVRRGKIIRLVQERYLRFDISCRIRECTLCKPLPTDVNASALPRHLSLGASHFLVPDMNLLLNHLELFERPEIRYIIASQTIFDKLYERRGYSARALVQRLRSILVDTRRLSILFDNEHFVDTFFDDATSCSGSDHVSASILALAKWYQRHLSQIFQQPADIPSPRVSDRTIVIYLTDSPEWIRRAREAGVVAQTLGQYLDNYFESSKNLRELYDSLTQTFTGKELRPPTTDEELPEKVSDVKTGFCAYWEDDVLEAGQKSQSLYKGKLCVDNYNSKEAWITLSHPSSIGDCIFISNTTYRNRAIDQDIVAVEILDKSLWTLPAGFELDNFRDQSDSASRRSAAPPSVQRSGRSVPCGRVVGVFERKWRPYVCTLLLDDSTAHLDSGWVTAVPWNSRIPKIRIYTRQYKELANSRISVRIDKWDVTSFYPQGHYIENLGPIGHYETEIKVLLKEYDAETTEFSMNALAELPPVSDLPWQPPGTAADLSKRRDLRSMRIFSIDPYDCQDIDDALSCCKLPNGNTQVGVHIADVSNFIKPNTPLDLEARSRATSIYLTGRRIDMLPSILSEHICSLRRQLDRFAISIIWEMDPYANIVNTWYGRTLIRSSHELSYEQAQAILDHSTISPPLSYADKKSLALLRSDLLELRRLYRIIRSRRINKCALELDSSEVKIQLNSEKQPISISIKEPLETSRMIAEYMILANTDIARYIYTHRPQIALLRCHPIPKEENFEQLIAMAKVHGFQIDHRSNASLAKSLNYAALHGGKIFGRILRSMATMAMSCAEYVFSEVVHTNNRLFNTHGRPADSFYHYGLATDLYTHFTSPIRRYADIIVHRILLDILDTTPSQPAPSHPSISSLTALSDHLNSKTLKAKQVQRKSTELFQALYFSLYADQHTKENAVIVSIKPNGFLVYLFKYGFKAPVYLEDSSGAIQIPNNAFSLDPSSYQSKITVKSYECAEDHSMMLMHTNMGTFSISIFDSLTVRVNVVQSRLRSPSIKLELIHFGADIELDSSFQDCSRTFVSPHVDGQLSAPASQNPLPPIDASSSPELSNSSLSSLKNSPLFLGLVDFEKYQQNAGKNLYWLLDRLLKSIIDPPRAKSAALISFREDILSITKLVPVAKKSVGRRVFQKDQFDFSDSCSYNEEDNQEPDSHITLHQGIERVEFEYRIQAVSLKAEKDFKSKQIQIAKSRYKPRH